METLQLTRQRKRFILSIDTRLVSDTHRQQPKKLVPNPLSSVCENGRSNGWRQSASSGVGDYNFPNNRNLLKAHVLKLKDNAAVKPKNQHRLTNRCYDNSRRRHKDEKADMMLAIDAGVRVERTESGWLL